MADFEFEESLSEETIKNNLELFLDYICDCVDATNLLMHLPVFSREQRKEIADLSTTSSKEATKLAIQVIQNTSYPNKYREFMEAIETSKYPKVVNILAGKHTPHDENCRKIVDLFLPELVGRISPFQLLPLLKEYNVLQENEEDMIRAEETNHGSRKACWLLLHYLPCREKNWFKYFLRALIRCKLEDLAQKLDPDLYENGNIVDVDKENVASKTPQDMSKEYCLQDKSHDLNIDSDSDSANLLDLAESKMKELKETDIPSKGDPSSELTVRKDISKENKASIKTEETFVKLVENVDALLEQPDHTDTIEVKQVVDCRSANENLLDLTDEFEILLLEELKAEKESGDPQNDLSIDTRAEAYDETKFNIVTDDDTIPDIEDKDIDLRNYQTELSREGSAGENVIIMAPTNCGKTRVACAVMQAHLRKCRTGHRIGRVIFVVENEALAGQQGVECVKELPAYRSKVISGSVQRDKHEYLKDFVNRRDILVVTAQVLVNALKEKEIEFVTHFSMIVFDECHHANACHPYNQIMSKYMDMKLNMDSSELPQIVGLTASIGVGGKTNEDEAKKHMKSIMANMDANYLCTVRQNIDELLLYENPAVAETVTVKGKGDDVFSVTIKDCVGQINRMMLEHPCMVHLEERDRKLLEKLCQISPCLGSEKFNQWLSDFKKVIGAISSDAARRVLNPCWHHLKVYNKAFAIHKDARVKEARAVLRVYMQNQIEYNTMKDDADEKLMALYTTVQKLDYNTIPENPKLIRLRKLILDVLGHDPNARGIIFVKTRELAKALINWTKETPELSPLNASEFVGQVAAASAGGMTKCAQKDILEYFNDGKHKLIIATSVAEEGLDIAKCNLVIRYEHVTNEIVRIQSRGRARAENSKYYVLTESGSGIATKEEKNAQLEQLMKQLVPVVQQEIELYQNDWHIQMKEMQNEAKKEERLKESEEKVKKKFGPCELQCLNCGFLICYDRDVKRIRNSHYVIVNDTVKEKIYTTRNPFPKFEEGKLKCDDTVNCRRCGYDLGGVCLYRTLEFPRLSVGSLRFKGQNGEGFTKEKWKRVPFYVEEFTSDDLRESMGRRLVE